MPGKHLSGDSGQQCRRCKENVSVLVVRSEPLCRDCFIKYVHTKVIKRMESFRVRNTAPDQQRKILLAVSFGVSSVSLLNILDHHLQTQKAKTGRTGFSLNIIFVNTSSVDSSAVPLDLRQRLQERFSEYHFTSVGLQDVFNDPQRDALHDIAPGLEVAGDSSPLQQLETLFKSLKTAAGRADVVSTLRTRLIVQHAKALGCEGVSWGDSTTKLAEKTLSETAKGRGFSLPWQTADGESPLGITFNYPMRDVLKKELVNYAEMTDPPLSSLIDYSTLSAPTTVNSKTTTIDDLMQHYFESVEENFPSIVSNVVRTTGKLEAPSTSESQVRCALCSMPVEDGRFGIHGWGGDQQDGVAYAPGESGPLCYGCTRSAPRNP
ncbi:cytoplasmic tRNA 2-thiolation protein 2 [Lophiotrema nucula]|uniref:Cytoplasmic tRNA 2-thiolation protein 2 n=1 Tax=Lophiotrema nucula TaxID=690887 RepID=A0A6A5YVY8_9PLEO|nr:cytoplasmic tRNA 2-thiolation protein 2 [Lophiotrema nucula]